MTGGEAAAFIHCSFSRAQGVPLVFILLLGETVPVET